MKNVIDVLIIISRNSKLNKLQNYEEKNCYFASSNDRYLIVKSSNWFKKIVKWIIVDIVDMIAFEKNFHEFILSSTSSITTSNIFSMSTNLISIDLKIVLFNNIIIYDDDYAVAKFFVVTKIYFNIWQKKIIDTINISKKKWMSINIISEIKLDLTRVFKFDKQNRDVIDKKFDELHR